MRYADGSEIKVGDTVAIHANDRGTVVACFDTREFSARCPEADWSYLTSGVMVDTSFAGLVHYQYDASDTLRLLARKTDDRID